jgi:hypothetical protein
VPLAQSYRRRPLSGARHDAVRLRSIWPDDHVAPIDDKAGAAPLHRALRARNGGRVRWVSDRPGEAPAYAGTDFIIARDGGIAAVYLFFDQLP